MKSVNLIFDGFQDVMLFEDGHLELPNGKRIDKPYASGQVRLPMGKGLPGRHVRLATLVAKHFVPNPDDNDFIGYKDGDRMNCSADNLMWIPNKARVNHELFLECRSQVIDLHVKGHDKKYIISKVNLNLNVINRIIDEFEETVKQAP